MAKKSVRLCEMRGQTGDQLWSQNNIQKDAMFLVRFAEAVESFKNDGTWDEVKHQTAQEIVSCYRWRRDFCSVTSAMKK